MAKRLTDTEKWKDDWYISLNNDDRIVWQWLLDNCSHAGFCKRSMVFLNLMCRVSYSEDEMIAKMDKRVLAISNDWFIPKFIKFQYSTLLSQKPVILSVVRELFQKNCVGIIPESFGDDYIIKEKSFYNHCQMIKDKDKDKDKYSKGAKNQKPMRGVKIDTIEKLVVFEDGSTQKLGEGQLKDLERGTLSARAIYQNSIH